ncbi:MFS transporter [Novosphingobium taihuense]|uniref:GPH family glycoside/pentoside/hexuronide:cation symporter n=1 Tax=Novosphingobium taihuense TaxID=260085 RepID=A0A7W7AA77_9SPHN|nr:MFS transporter [Novosphingobium taihuense]MBB4613300.1 GPH family glycoside/pentoside/hexuronide:cation symporter [Novosphingobium taihuense]TWH85441.1 GPH family glycoside/pentoside/hexuronide:cation symporter [Novosphingobium taihuense]
MIPIEGKVPTRLALANGLGSVAYGVKDNGFATFLLLFYNQVLGMDARLVSLALLIALVFDGLIDPIVGHFSDRTRTAWGRRLPFLYLAPIPLALAWVFLWSPIGKPSFVMLLVSAIMVRALVAMCEVPSAALVAEISRDYDERTRLTRFRFLFSWGGGLLMLLLAYGVFLPNAMLAREGYRNFGLFGAALMVTCVLVSAIGQHRAVAGWPPERASSGKSALASLGEIRESFSHPACLIVMAGIAAALTAQGLTFALSNYLYLYVWKFTPTALQAFPFLLFASVVGASLLVGRAQLRWGKAGTVMRMAPLGMVFWAGPLLLRWLGLWAPDGSTASLAGMFACTLLSNTFTVTGTMTLWSMVADVVEASEEQTGRRSEGTLSAGAFLASKCAGGLGVFCTGLLLSFAGLEPNTAPDSVAPEVTYRLSLAYVASIAVLAALTAFVVRRFPIDRATHQARLARLDQVAKTDPDAAGLHP